MEAALQNIVLSSGLLTVKAVCVCVCVCTLCYSYVQTLGTTGRPLRAARYLKTSDSLTASRSLMFFVSQNFGSRNDVVP